MATTRKRLEPAEWDGAYLVAPVDDEVDTMPRRAAGLPTQNGGAMRAVFAYLLDEDPPPVEASPPATPAPAARSRKKRS
jgi:hypothetical protein